MKVQHDEERQAFTVELEGEAEPAELTYSRPEDGVIDFNHTFVPEPSRHKGVAAEMAKAALAFAQEKGLKVVPSCPYVDAYVKKHGEYADLLK
jgi:uncharacterized protein